MRRDLSVKLCAAHVALLGVVGAARAAEEPLKLKMSGMLEAGIMHHGLSAGYGVWNGQFVRGVLQTDAVNVWNGEIVHASQFGDSGVLLASGLTHTINPDWFVAGGVSTSAGGFFLPRLRLDLSISRKWLEQRNLVTTVGVTVANAKDGHSDRSVLLAAAYYFERPWVVEGGVRLNQSNPGGIASTTVFVAGTYGREKWRLVSLRYQFGTEAYQLIGNSAALADFRSDAWTLTWREWVARDYGFQLRVESYRNPTYGRQGVELSVFKDF